MQGTIKHYVPNVAGHIWANRYLEEANSFQHKNVPQLGWLWYYQLYGYAPAVGNHHAVPNHQGCLAVGNHHAVQEPVAVPNNQGGAANLANDEIYDDLSISPADLANDDLSISPTDIEGFDPMGEFTKFGTG